MADYQGVRAVITGGAGFIGSHLADALLARGAAEVVVVDNFFLGKEANLADARAAHGDRLTIYREDAADATAMAAIFDRHRPDLAFNLATKALLYSFFNPPGACRVNLDIALVLAELLRAGAYGKLVHLSSSEVYGTARSVPMGEDHPLQPETTYAAGKAAADLLLATYCRMFDADIVTVRPFNNYGPRQNDGAMAAVVPLTVQRIRQGRAPVIQGDGLQTRDFIYVGDTVRGILDVGLAGGLRGQTINLASGIETTIREIVEQLCAAMSYAGGIDHEPARKADVRRHVADTSRFRELFPAFTLTPLAQGLRSTVEWYLGR